MKRSEMLKIIKSCIKLNHFDELNQYLRGEISAGRLAEICAETILNRIEKEGMLPPSIELRPLGGRDNAWDPETK